MADTQNSVKQILFIQTAFLGDVLLTIPALKKLRQQHPTAEITYVCRTGLGSVLKKLELVEHFYEIHKGHAESYRHVTQNLKSVVFDLLITPHESLRTSLFSWQIKARHKRGPASFFNRFVFDERIHKKSWLPEALRVLQFCHEEKWSALSPQIFYALAEDRLTFDVNGASMGCLASIQKCADFQTLSQSFPKNGKRLLLFPGSVWETKKYPLRRYQDVVRSLIQQGFEIVLMGSKAEENLGLQLQTGFENQVVNLVGKTNLIESLCLMALSGCVLGNDSGSAHMASVAECPSVTVFGPTILEFGYRPWSNQSFIVQTTQKLTCRPCGKHGHKACPIGTHECMTSIPPQEVVRVVQRILSA